MDHQLLTDLQIAAIGQEVRATGAVEGVAAKADINTVLSVASSTPESTQERLSFAPRAFSRLPVGDHSAVS